MRAFLHRKTKLIQDTCYLLFWGQYEKHNVLTRFLRAFLHRITKLISFLNNNVIYSFGVKTQDITLSEIIFNVRNNYNDADLEAVSESCELKQNNHNIGYREI